MTPEPVVVAPGTASVLPTQEASVRLRPLAAPPRLDQGFWGRRIERNGTVSVPHGYRQLVAAGNFHNLRLAAGMTGSYRALLMFDGPFPFLDSDVYKWLEAVAWELERRHDDDTARMADEAIGLIAAAQRPDGYLNTFVQVLGGGRAFGDLAWGHELYTLGHLAQAAVAWVRALGDTRLLAVVERAVAFVDHELGEGGRDGIDGHPEIEMALVELYRVTGNPRHLALAQRFVDLRGHGLLGDGRFGVEYWQDHLPVRSAPIVTGHAVRQLYLDCGAVDLAVERGDVALLAAVIARWDEMRATRVYLTGGVGSHHKDESFGDPFELPPDRAYTETCAAIASVMLAWRLLLATGEPRFADAMERAIYNAVLPGVALDGRSFFYVNPLQRRAAHPTSPGDGERAPWFPCACCPPNMMRTFASWPQYLATTDERGLQVHQYATGEIAATVAGAPVRVSVETDYPNDGAIDVRVLDGPATPWELALRVPAWCREARFGVDDEAVRTVTASERADGVIRELRSWRPGQRLRLELAMPPRVTEPDPRIDAVRGCVAVERGPLVYCLEDVDLPAGTALDHVALEVPAALRVADAAGLPDDLVILAGAGRRREANHAGWPYPEATPTPGDAPTVPATAVDLILVPYLAWANRGGRAMRVWIPRG